MLSEQKQILRQEAIRHRSAMHADIEDIEKTYALFWENINPTQNQTIAAYWPKGREFDPIPILEQAIERGHTCGLPITSKDSKTLRFAAWDKNTELVSGLHDILEPAQNDQTEYLAPDIIIVPLLAFDRRGYRLGYGGGYYDATLQSLRASKPITAVGLAYAQQTCLFNLPTEDHDQRLNWVITPQEAQHFGD